MTYHQFTVHLYPVWDTIPFTTRTLHTRMPRVGLVYCFQLQRHWQDLYPDVGAMSFGPFCTRNGQVHVCSFFGETFGPVFSVAAYQSPRTCWRPPDHFEHYYSDATVARLKKNNVTTLGYKLLGLRSCFASTPDSGKIDPLLERWTCELLRLVNGCTAFWVPYKAGESLPWLQLQF